MACTKKLLTVITEAVWPATDRQACRRPRKDAAPLLQNRGYRPGPIVRFNTVATYLPDVPNILVSVDAGSLPLPIEFITLAHGAISFGSDIDIQWNPAQRALVEIGLVLFQLTSEWNWLAGATWQAADLDDNFETMLWASDEVSVKVFKEYAKRCCWFVL